MHRKRVTSELHNSYFRLMTIKHSISKIQWAIMWALNYYIMQLSSSPSREAEAERERGSWQRHLAVEFGRGTPSSSRVGGGEGRDVVGKATPGRRGLLALISWGPEKMLIRCHKESQHPAEWALGLRLSIKRTRKTQRDGHKEWRSKYEVYVRSPAPSHSKTPHNLFEPLQ